MQINKLEQSEAYHFMLELKELRKEVSRDKGRNLFERWVTWLSNCDPVKDPLGYSASGYTIFTVIMVLKDLISDEERKEMGRRVVVVIERNGYEDEDHRDFIERQIGTL